MSGRTIKQDPLLSAINGRLIVLPSPSNLNSNWNYGSTLGVCLTVQIITGLFLAIHYIGDTKRAFIVVTHICENVNYGWWIRALHANGASLFFIVCYMHIGRGIYFGSYELVNTWIRGVSILFILIATAFLGYVLPWGQISFWGATVITNLISAVPYFGERIVYWLWGGFAVGGRTLTRFFTLHFLCPFVLLALVLIHLISLHETGSSNPLGVNSNYDKLPFYPYFAVKDLVGWVVFFGALLLLRLQAPWLLGDSENFIPANSLVTPVHIKPEWYFLFAYAILRSVPNKLGGVIGLVMSLGIFYFLPLRVNHVKATRIRIVRKTLFWWFLRVCLILTWIGGNPVEEPYILIGQLTSGLYYSYFLVLIIY